MLDSLRYQQRQGLTNMLHDVVWTTSGVTSTKFACEPWRSPKLFWSVDDLTHCHDFDLFVSQLAVRPNVAGSAVARMIGGRLVSGQIDTRSVHLD